MQTRVLAPTLHLSRALVNWILAAGCCWFPVATAVGAESILQMSGADFNGGGQSHFGKAFYGREVNYVYAQSTDASVMRASLLLEREPSTPLFLYLEAMDDDAASPCRVQISLNGHDLHNGPSGFPEGRWRVRRFALPASTLIAGTNVLTIANLEPSGPLGTPPWFMVARLALADAEFKLPTPEMPTFRVPLPDQARPFPEPLTAGHSQPGFKFRGTKGWNWTAEQYLEEIPSLAKFKMNFLMNCYLSMFTSEPGEPFKNEWWKPMSVSRKAGYAKVIRQCAEQGITFCFAVHPQLGSPRPLNPASDEDIEQFFQHYAWAQSQGVRWFSISLDDVSWGDPAAGGSAHAKLVNAVFNRLRATDPAAQFVFCPGPYWGDGTEAGHRPYLSTLGREMQPDVYVFWTGDGVVTPRITRKAAESYKAVVKHRLFLWDNYPVNDSSPTLHLGPVSGRDPDLCEVIDGYMSNPMASQNQLNRLPLATCADYAFNPWGYDPARSIGQAILQLTSSAPQQRSLKQLVELYPGFLTTGGGTGVNPVRTKFANLAADDETRAAALQLLKDVESAQTQFEKAFPNQFSPSRKTIAEDIGWMKQQRSSGNPAGSW